jgi:hypothetical protein
MKEPLAPSRKEVGLAGSIQVGQPQRCDVLMLWEGGWAAHMILSARASQARAVTGAPVSSTAERAVSAASEAGAQMRTTPSRSAVTTFWPPGEKAAATTAASCPSSSSVCAQQAARPKQHDACSADGFACAIPFLLSYATLACEARYDASRSAHEACLQYNVLPDTALRLQVSSLKFLMAAVLDASLCFVGIVEWPSRRPVAHESPSCHPHAVLLQQAEQLDCPGHQASRTAHLQDDMKRHSRASNCVFPAKSCEIDATFVVLSGPSAH